MPRLADSAMRHFRRLQRSNGIMASILSGNKSSSDVIVVMGRSDSIGLPSREVIYTASAQEFLVAECDYPYQEEPQPGDKISYEDWEGRRVVVEVLPSSDSQPCFTRWRGCPVFRVFCKVCPR